MYLPNEPIALLDHQKTLNTLSIRYLIEYNELMTLLRALKSKSKALSTKRNIHFRQISSTNDKVQIVRRQANKLSAIKTK